MYYHLTLELHAVHTQNFILISPVHNHTDSKVVRDPVSEFVQRDTSMLFLKSKHADENKTFGNISSRDQETKQFTDDDCQFTEN